MLPMTQSLFWLGGWETPEHVLKTYGHALKNRTLTDVLVDGPDVSSILERVSR